MYAIRIKIRYVDTPQSLMRSLPGMPLLTIIALHTSNSYQMTLRTLNYNWKSFCTYTLFIHWRSISNIKQTPKLVIINISKRERLVRYFTKYFYVCNHPVSIALYRILSNVHFGLQLYITLLLYIILLILLNYCDVLPLNSTVTLKDNTPPLLVLGCMICFRDISVGVILVGLACTM
jgi:hypothetical protein